MTGEQREYRDPKKSSIESDEETIEEFERLAQAYRTWRTRDELSRSTYSVRDREAEAERAGVNLHRLVAS